jgi:hypothetical protein
VRVKWRKVDDPQGVVLNRKVDKGLSSPFVVDTEGVVGSRYGVLGGLTLECAKVVIGRVQVVT